MKPERIFSAPFSVLFIISSSNAVDSRSEMMIQYQSHNVRYTFTVYANINAIFLLTDFIRPFFSAVKYTREIFYIHFFVYSYYKVFSLSSHLRWIKYKNVKFSWNDDKIKRTKCTYCSWYPTKYAFYICTCSDKITIAFLIIGIIVLIRVCNIISLSDMHIHHFQFNFNTDAKSGVVGKWKILEHEKWQFFAKYNPK